MGYQIFMRVISLILLVGSVFIYIDVGPTKAIYFLLTGIYFLLEATREQLKEQEGE